MNNVVESGESLYIQPDLHWLLFSTARCRAGTSPGHKTARGAELSISLSVYCM